MLPNHRLSVEGLTVPTCRHLFISGIEKCGTSALAEWFVSNGLARYRVPGVKEPYLYAWQGESETTGSSVDRPGVLLDASVGYAFNPAAIERMPQRDTRIILCLRNHFERCYSVYSAWHVIAQRGADAARVLDTIPLGSISEYYGVPLEHRESFLFEVVREIIGRQVSVDQKAAVDREVLEQADLISSQSFMERVDYEMEYHRIGGAFPFFSVLGSGFYSQALGNLLDRYEASQITLVTLDQLTDQSTRLAFAETVLNRHISLPLTQLDRINATAALEIARQIPDFHADEWSALRGAFVQDLVSFETIAARRGLSMRFVTTERLHRFLDTEDVDVLPRRLA